MSQEEFIYSTEEVSVSNANSFDVDPEISIEPYELVAETDNTLNHRTKEFDFSVDDPVVIASRLIETARKYQLYNLAANQCGLNHRLFVAGFGDEYVAFFNPTILYYGEEELIMDEVDANIPALQLKIKRPNAITIEYRDFNNELKYNSFTGLTSRLLQQSCDRLDGINIKSKVSSFVLNRALKSKQKKIKKYVRAVLSYHKLKTE